MKKCIVYYPFKINFKCPSASNIRPLKILKGFEDRGYKVELIEGYAEERKEKVMKLKKDILNGDKYDFLYMETSTEPTLLTDSNHLPMHPFFDYSFLRFCKKNSIRIGLFYRDIHWKFEQYKNNVSLPKRIIAYSFYYYDLRMYKRYIDVLFLPSYEMEKYIPIKLNKKVVELPSGCEGDFLGIEKCKAGKRLNVLYVGGIGKELYNIELLVKAINEDDNFELTICCRKEEWQSNKFLYEKYLNERIKIVHLSGIELDEEAEKADLYSIVVKPTEYWKFVMPMKLFTYIRYGKPILAIKDIVSGKFVEDNKIGYTVNYDIKEIKEELNLIKEAYEKEFVDKQFHLKNTFENNTWTKRASSVIECLNN